MSKTLSTDQKKLLKDILWSYISASGQELDDNMKQIDKALSESTPKSAREKMYRKTRMKNARPKTINMKSRIVPKKSADTDPTRSGHRIQRDVADNLREAILFLCDNHTKTISQIRESLSGFKHTETLKKFVNRIIALNMGGWRDIGESYENGSGHRADKTIWDINRGWLVSRNRRPCRFDLDTLHKFREACDV